MFNKKVTNIIFKAKMDGVGTVNFDGSDSRWIAKAYGNPARSSYEYTDSVRGIL